jgi:hypothetical protein
MPYYHISPDRRELTEASFRRGLWCTLVGQYETLTPQKFADLTKATDSSLDDLEAYSTSDDPLPGQSPVRPARLPEFAALWQTSLGPTRGEMYKRCYPNADNFVPSGLDQTTRPWSEHHQRTPFPPPLSGFACGRFVLPGAGRTLLNGRWLPPHMPWV